MRRKLFGAGICTPADRNEKARLLHRARAMMRPTEPGKHYGAITAKQFAQSWIVSKMVLTREDWSSRQTRSTPGLCVHSNRANILPIETLPNMASTTPPPHRSEPRTCRGRSRTGDFGVRSPSSPPTGCRTVACIQNSSTNVRRCNFAHVSGRSARP